MDLTAAKLVDTLGRKHDIPVWGAASAQELDQNAPQGFRPSDLLPGAKTVVILAKPLPLSVFSTDVSYNNAFYANTFDTYYSIMNEAAANICLALEKAGHLSLPVPAYSPLRFVDGQPRGLLSLKHAAVYAGLGKMGKNTLLIHPKYGNILRLGGLVTTCEIQPTGPKEFPRLCPEKCHVCENACPVSAIDNGTINKISCMTNCITHPFLPPAFVMGPLSGLMKNLPKTNRLMEIFTYSFFEKYQIACTTCLKSCPHFPGHAWKKAQKKSA